MKSLRKSVPFLFAAATFTGCVVSRTVYLQDASVSGPISEPPLFVVADSRPDQFTIAARITPAGNSSMGVSTAGHSPVNARGEYQLDTVRNGYELSFRETPGANAYPFIGKNLRWDLAGTTVAVDAQYTVSNHFALVFGGSYSTKGSEGYWGGTVGGALFTEGERAAFRLDGGVQFRTLSYTALTAVVIRTTPLFGSPAEEVGLYRDRGRTTFTDFYGSLTINTRNPDWPVHVFLQCALSRQQVLNHTPSQSAIVFPFLLVVDTHEGRAEYVRTILTATPGLSVALGDGLRLLAGGRYMTSVAGETGEDVLLSRWSPFLQMQFAF